MSTKGSDRSSTEPSQKFYSDRTGDNDDSMCSTDEQLDEYGRSMLSRLRTVIEGDLIPRLMLAVETPSTEYTSTEIAERLKHCVDDFVQLLLAHDASVASKYVEMLRSEGASLPALYLDLLAPAARRLGTMWDDDECSFTDVTIGVCRMHQVILEFSRCFDATSSPVESGKNALIVPVPGEQHTFGIFMVMEFLRKNGWNCFSGNPSNKAEFHKLLRSQEFDVIGISLSSERHLDTARSMLREIKSGSRNADSTILAGGRVFSENPELAYEIGADATALDGVEAVAKIERLYKENKRLISKQ